ncbi:MAG: hypothetical protein EBZ47_00190 [Chlamydiae bacterium]|nr:hypothetical protein [Chlamydiota bacterium]
MANNINCNQFITLSEGRWPLSQIGLSPEGHLCSRFYSLGDFLGWNKEQNAQVWSLFKKNFSKELGKDRFKSICKRYNIDYQAAKEKGSSLPAAVVHLLKKGCQTVNISDLKGIEGSDICHLLPHQIHDQYVKLNKFASSNPWDGCEISGRVVTDFCRPSFEANEGLSRWSTSSAPSYQSYLEVFIKSIGCTYLKEGDILPATSIDGRYDYYKVYKKISKAGLIAYAFKPISKFSFLEPFLLFRPTVTSLAKEDCLLTLMNDFEQNLGFSGYGAAKEELDQLANDKNFCTSDKKLKVAGFSLGGVHAQRFTADHFDKVEHIYSVNAPSVESSLAAQFADSLNYLSPDDKQADIKIHVVRTKDDIVHFVGQRHLGHGVRHPKVYRELVEIELLSSENQQNTLMELVKRHVYQVFHGYKSEQSTPFILKKYPSDQFDSQTDNSKSFYENLRSWFGYLVLYPLLYGIHSLFFVVHKYLHVSLLPYSEPKFDYTQWFKHLFTPSSEIA